MLQNKHNLFMILNRFVTSHNYVLPCSCCTLGLQLKQIPFSRKYSSFLWHSAQCQYEVVFLYRIHPSQTNNFPVPNAIACPLLHSASEKGNTFIFVL